MYNRVKKYISQNQMIKHGDHIIAGVSGGADSVCLIFVLLALQKEISFSMQVAHINHMLRPEADKDAAFVADLCLKHDIGYKIFASDVGKLSRKRGLSVEEAGRGYRYECFREMINEFGKGKIAVAHHQDDRAETILFNLFRGSGLRGLTGIRPVRDDIIRPLLCLTRQEIENYLESEKIPYCTDSTNNDDIYTRNRIRRHIIPFAAEVNSEAVRHMAKTAELVWEAENYLHKHTEKAFCECVTPFLGYIKINLLKLNEQDIIIKKRIMLMVIEKLLPGRANISASHIESLTGLTLTGGSRKLNLPNGLIAAKEYDTLVIKIAEKEPIEFKNKIEAGFSYEINLKTPKMSIPELGIISCRIFPYKEVERNLSTIDFEPANSGHEYKNENIPQKMYTKWLDYDKITSCALFRRRLPGDYLIINLKGQHKKLKDYLINEKIPKAKREQMLVLADESHIIWVPGFRISEFYKVTNKTKTILEVELTLE